MREELRALRAEGALLESLGFSVAELDELVPAGDQEPVQIEEIDVGQVSDRFWISIRGPLESQAAVFKALHDATRGIVGVTVEHGTTQDG